MSSGDATGAERMGRMRENKENRANRIQVSRYILKQVKIREKAKRRSKGVSGEEREN
jgi:hypothetical protein